MRFALTDYVFILLPALLALASESVSHIESVSHTDSIQVSTQSITSSASSTPSSASYVQSAQTSSAQPISILSSPQKFQHILAHPTCALSELPSISSASLLSTESTTQSVLLPLPTPKPFLSFDEWKAQHPPPPPDPSPDLDVTPPPTENAVQPQSNIPLSTRFNYASFDCAAFVHAHSPDARSPSAILSGKKDRYMLAPCATEQFVVIELCDEIRIDTIVLANYEYFSGVFKKFTLSVSPTLPGEWTQLAQFRAKNVRGLQVFPLPIQQGFYRYIRIDITEHFGKEYYCPLSLVRVYGMNQMDVFRKEEASKVEDLLLIPQESIASASYQVTQSSQDTPEIAAVKVTTSSIVFLATDLNSNEHSLEFVASTSQYPAAPSSSPEQIVKESHIAKLNTLDSISPQSSAPLPSPSIPSPPSPSSTSVQSQSLTQLVSSHKPETTQEHERSLKNETESAVNFSTEQQSIQVVSDEIIQSVTSSTTAIVQDVSEVANDSNAVSNNATQTTVFEAATSTIPVTDFNSSTSSINSAANANGETIYRTITKRLGFLEGNLTLSLRYIEDQSRMMRDTFQSMELTWIDRLDDAAKKMDAYWTSHHQVKLDEAVAQVIRSGSMQDRERSNMKAQINSLTEEIIMQKRLAIAQLLALVAVMVFMALTRGTGYVDTPSIILKSQGRRSAYTKHEKENVPLLRVKRVREETLGEVNRKRLSLSSQAFPTKVSLEKHYLDDGSNQADERDALQSNHFYSPERKSFSNSPRIRTHSGSLVSPSTTKMSKQAHIHSIDLGSPTPAFKPKKHPPSLVLDSKLQMFDFNSFTDTPITAGSWISTLGASHKGSELSSPGSVLPSNLISPDTRDFHTPLESPSKNEQINSLVQDAGEKELLLTRSIEAI